MKRVDYAELSAEEALELPAAFGDEAVDNREIVDLTDELLVAAEEVER